MISKLADLLSWSEWTGWYLLETERQKIPKEPGIYRVRREGQTAIDYVGQTGEGSMTLRKRVSMLSGVFGDEMPYRAPHTAAPALWALRHQTKCSFEVSVLPLRVTTQEREGMEALAIALYRQQTGASPTVNFGRIPAGYRMSSANKKRLVDAGKRYRGGPTLQAEPNHAKGIAPIGALSGTPTDQEWCGHRFSAWVDLQPRFMGPDSKNGLYRIRDKNQPTLLYIGEGDVLSRLYAHLGKTKKAGHLQGAIFAKASRLQASWVLNDKWEDHHRLEMENDFIGAHVLCFGVPPAAQFLG